MVSAGHVGDGTRGSGIVSSAADVLWMSMVCGMRVIGGVCEMCMSLARSGVDEMIWYELYQSFGYRGSVSRVSLFGLWGSGYGVWTRVVVVRLSVHVHFNLGLLPRDS